MMALFSFAFPINNTYHYLDKTGRIPQFI